MYRACCLSLGLFLLSFNALAQTGAAAVEALPPSAAEQKLMQAATAAYDKRRYAAAAKHFDALIVKNNPWAMFNKAAMIVQGEAKAKDPFTAQNLLKRAVSLGYIPALLPLAQTYEHGFGEKSLSTAVSLYGKAAEAGSLDAQIEYATALYLGRGIAKNEADSAKWYLEAAKQGSIDAQYMVATLYENGYGVNQDLRIAKYWYNAAAKQGDRAASEKLKTLD